MASWCGIHLGATIYQRFLLTAAARTVSVREVFEISDEAAFRLLRELRW